jgi:hypothetical protein
VQAFAPRGGTVDPVRVAQSSAVLYPTDTGAVGERMSTVSRKRRRRTGRGPPTRYPIATVMRYGPDDKTVTKIAVGIIPAPDAEPTEIGRWVGTGVKSDPKVTKEIEGFLRSHGVRTKITAPVVMGCPHEEGEDFPEGEDCPFCPFWKGKQGSGVEVEERWSNLKELHIEYPRASPGEDHSEAKPDTRED